MECLNEKKRCASYRAVKTCQCDKCCQLREKQNVRNRAFRVAHPGYDKVWRDVNHEKVRAGNAVWRANNSEYMWPYWLKQNYGITPDEYNEMLIAQGGGCAICGKLPDKKRLAVDHDHKTGKVRGILCEPCNHGLGNFHDSPVLMRGAIEYIERSRRES